MCVFVRESGGLMYLKLNISCVSFMFDKPIGYVELSKFPFCKYNGGGLMREGWVDDGLGTPWGCVFPWRRSYNYFDL